MGKSWTQTPEGRKRMSEIQKKVWAEKRSPLQRMQLAKTMTARSKRNKVRKAADEFTTLRVNGWSIRLSKNEIVIDHD